MKWSNRGNRVANLLLFSVVAIENEALPSPSIEVAKFAYYKLEGILIKRISIPLYRYLTTFIFLAPEMMYFFGYCFSRVQFSNK